MEEQKAGSQLNLALNISPKEREKLQELEVGYEQATKEWELIVKYNGSLERVREISRSVTELYGGYAIVIMEEEAVDTLFAMPEIEYVEKPKELFFQTLLGKQVSCITAVQTEGLSLYGEGTLIGIVDSGIAYEQQAFRNADGSTRIVRLWDQSIEGNPPKGYEIGTEYTKEDIDLALSMETRQEQLRIVPSTDRSGHGTGVADIAAGSLNGIASKAELVIVKMGVERKNGFPRTTELMQGLNYLIEQAISLEKPMAVNISFGNTYGSHDGTSLVEKFIDTIAPLWKTVICIGMGNEGSAAGHTALVAVQGEETELPLAIGAYQTAMSVQIWKDYVDELEISLLSPDGRQIGPIRESTGVGRYSLDGEEVLLYYGAPAPYSTQQEIYLSFVPEDGYLQSGIWTFLLKGKRIVEGSVALWLPSQEVLSQETRFLFSTPNQTLTIPATASAGISVGAYDPRSLTYADFSGRGREISDGRQKPDLAAPGVDISVVTPQGSLQSVSGTSFATPFVTGGAALLLEWGIVRGNDPFLWGEKIKAYLHRGAKPLPGFFTYPNNQVGYGALCIKDSIP